MDCSPPAPLSMGISRQEYWSGLPCLLQGIFLTQLSNPFSCIGRWFFTTEPLVKPTKKYSLFKYREKPGKFKGNGNSHPHPLNVLYCDPFNKTAFLLAALGCSYHFSGSNPGWVESICEQDTKLYLHPFFGLKVHTLAVPKYLWCIPPSSMPMSFFLLPGKPALGTKSLFI